MRARVRLLLFASRGRHHHPLTTHAPTHPYRTTGQEPGSDADIQAFAKAKGAKYPVFAKVSLHV